MSPAGARPSPSRFSGPVVGGDGAVGSVRQARPARPSQTGSGAPTGDQREEWLCRSQRVNVPVWASQPSLITTRSCPLWPSGLAIAVGARTRVVSAEMKALSLVTLESP